MGARRCGFGPGAAALERMPERDVVVGALRECGDARQARRAQCRGAARSGAAFSVPQRAKKQEHRLRRAVGEKGAGSSCGIRKRGRGEAGDRLCWWAGRGWELLNRARESVGEAEGEGRFARVWRGCCTGALNFWKGLRMSVQERHGCVHKGRPCREVKIRSGAGARKVRAGPQEAARDLRLLRTRGSAARAGETVVEGDRGAVTQRGAERNVLRAAAPGVRRAAHTRSRATGCGGCCTCRGGG